MDYGSNEMIEVCYNPINTSAATTTAAAAAAVPIFHQC